MACCMTLGPTVVFDTGRVEIVVVFNQLADALIGAPAIVLGAQLTSRLRRGICTLSLVC